MVHRNENEYDCEECGKTIRGKSQFETHMNDVHSEQEPSQCEYCGKTYKSEKLKAQHIDIMHMDSGVKCSVCSKEVPKQRLAKHMRYFHQQQRLFTCEVCGKSFKADSLVSKHIKRVHAYRNDL